MVLTLVSYKICPYVVRVASALFYKNIPFEIKYIDLNDRPEWFNKISPLEKVPILIIDENKVLFESNVILDYIDTISPPSIQPITHFERALARAKQEFAGEIQQTLSAFKYAKTHEKIEELKADLKWYFEKLEPWLQNKYLLGDQVSLADFSYAPLFSQIKAMSPLLDYDAYEGFPNIKQYGIELLSLEAVQKAIVPDFDELIIQKLHNQEVIYQNDIYILQKKQEYSYTALLPEYHKRTRLYLK